MIRDIIRNANVSIDTFYNYYKSKPDVYYENYLIADEYFETDVRPWLMHISDMQERILAFFDDYAGYNSEISGLSLSKILYNSANKCFGRHSEQYEAGLTIHPAGGYLVSLY